MDNPGNLDEKIPVQINITLPRLSCECTGFPYYCIWNCIETNITKFSVVGIDIQDELGRHDVGFIENTVKTPFNGKKGCIFESVFHINRVPGDLKFANSSRET